MSTRPAPEAPKRRTHTVEPELQQPLPRRVRAGLALQIFRWILGVGLVASAVFYATGLLVFSTKGSSIPLLVLAFTAIAFIFWAVIEPTYRLKRGLARTGTVTVAVMLAPPGPGVGDVLRAFSSRGANNSKAVSYRYRVGPEEWREVTKRIQTGWSGAAWSAEGSTVSVLHDPADPGKHVLYPTLRPILKIIAP